MTHEYHSPTPSGRNGATALVVALILGGCALVLWIVLVADPKATVAVAAPLFTLVALLIGLRAVRGTTDDADDAAVARFNAGVLSIKRVHKSLVENEELLWETKTHPIAVVPWWIAAVLLFAAGAWVTLGLHAGTGLAVMIVAVLGMGLRLLAWYLDRLCITNMRLLRVHGILFVRKDKMALSKMTDASLHIPRLSTVLNWLRVIGTQYGTLHVETAGQKQSLDEIPWIPYATVVDNLVMSRVLREPK